MSRPIRYERLPTEQPNPRSRFLDRLSTVQILRLMNHEDTRVPRAVASVVPQVARAVSLIVKSLHGSGRLFFLGAGTSGRLGIIEAAECPPTFNTPPDMVQAIIAGGRPAAFRPHEGVEDDRRRARREIMRRVRRGDVVVGIAASGVTPFVEAGLQAAKQRGTATVLLTCHHQASIRMRADVVITPQVGPELITGSTRLKAGTATKLILNMLTVATMVRLGKVYGNLMIDVRPASRKLKARAVRIIQQIAGTPRQHAAQALQRAHGQVTIAIVMAARKLDYPKAKRLLLQHNGMLRQALRNASTSPH